MRRKPIWPFEATFFYPPLDFYAILTCICCVRYSDLKMLEALVPGQGGQVPNAAVQPDAPNNDFMSATYGGTPSAEASKRPELAPTVSSSALLAGTPQKSAANAGWKKGVMDRNFTLSSATASNSSNNSSPASTLRNRLDPDSLEDDAMMATLMPGSTPGESPARPSFAASSHRTLRPSNTQATEEDSEEEDYDYDMDMDLDDTEEMDGLFPSANRLILSDSSTSTSSVTSDILAPKPSMASAHSSTTISPTTLLGPPPTTAARTPPTASPPTSVVLPTSPSPPIAATSTKPGVPVPPPNPEWFDDTQNTVIASSPPVSPSSSSTPTTPPQTSRFQRSGPSRPQIRNNAARITLAGTDEDMGMVRRADIARLPMPRFRKDYHVSILIQYSDNSKDVLEYKNRVHPDCTGADIIQECVNKTKKKVPNWNAPADKFQAFELIIPTKNDEDEDIIMDLETPVWKYCFIPGEVTRLVMRLKMRFDSARIALKIRTDRGPLRTMMFYSITPISMVIEKIQHKIKSAEKRGPPFTGLFVFDNKRGRFLENLSKTLGDYRVRNMDIIQVKRRRLMELCLRDQPKRNLMIPLDLTASLLAEQLHDWLRLDPVDPSTLSLVKVVPKRGNVAEMQLVLNANTEVRSFNLFKDDVIQLRRKASPKDITAPASTSAAAVAASSSAAEPANSPPRAAVPTNLMMSLDSRHQKTGSQQVSKTPSDPIGSPRANAVHASIKLGTPPTSPSATSNNSSFTPNGFLGGARSHVADSMGTIVATFQVAFAGNAHDSQTFSQSSFMAGNTRRFPPPKLMMGEVGLFQTIYGIYLWDSSTRLSMLGDVHITNYRLVFSSFSDDTLSDYFIDVPLTTIARVEKTGDKSKPGLKIDCKDFRTLRFHFERADAGKENRRQMRRLLEECLYPNFKQLFALAFKSAKPQVSLGNVTPSMHISSPRRATPTPSRPGKIDGWSILDLRAEFQRLGVGSGDKGSKWRISTLNETYAFSKTYPSLIVVPASISDEELVPVFKYRSKGRLPALSWFNSRTGASITRCSQPLTGVTKKTSPDDANLISAIKEAQGSADAKLHLLDARPRANAIANMAMGGGFEVMGGSAYNGCDLEFLNIGNIHVMRNSLSDLKSLIESQPYDNSFLSRIEASGWLFHVSLVLQGAVKIVEHMQQRHSCVLHCSDGWDRTSQLSAVAMILLDPYYRTTRGFCILIEKEWCTFGHKFASRNGHIAIDHVDKNYAHGERAPIFLQFIDCVYQVIRQFPLAFEFNENVLLCVLEHLYSCHYGTFLFDCERERKEADLANRTESLWTFILDPENDDKFKNIFYEPFDSILPLAPTLADVVLWRAYYRRWYAPPDEDKLTVEEKIRSLVSTNERQAERIALLEQRLAALERP